MGLPYYHVDAFAAAQFQGNPAGVCWLSESLPDAVLQNIAAENNLPETVFVLPAGERFHLRWFTPQMEVDLCGHATLATAHVIWRERKVPGDLLTFETREGIVRVERRGDLLALDFPSWLPRGVAAPPNLDEILGGVPWVEAFRTRDLFIVLKDEQAVANLRPRIDLIAQIPDIFGFAVTAPSDETARLLAAREKTKSPRSAATGTWIDSNSAPFEFVSRFFAPSAGINEDPVTGSAHCSLAPYWCGRWGQTRLRARQLSARGGQLQCEVRRDRVFIAGHAVTYLRGELNVPGIDLAPA